MTATLQLPRMSRPWADGETGVAAIEFIILFPVLLLLFFGSINLMQLASTHRNVATVAELVADLVTRHTDTISAADISDYYIAAELAMRPANTANMHIDLYDYYRSSNSVKTRWKVASPNGAACSAPAPVLNNPTNTIGSLLTVDDRDIVVAVVCMPFNPPIVRYPGLDAFFGTMTIRREFALKPRQSDQLRLN